MTAPSLPLAPLDPRDPIPAGPQKRTAYQREYMRRQRAAKLAVKNASATVCQAKRGMHAVCGGVLEHFTDGNGRMATRCPLCEKKRRGICRDCGLPVAGRVGSALRCAYHTRVERDAAQRRYRVRDPEAYRRSARKSYQTNAAERRRRNEYKKLWRAANPEKVKAMKRREALTPNDNRRAYHAARRERERQELAARERARYYGATPLRTCVTHGCNIVVTHRKKKCSKCREAARRAAVIALTPCAQVAV